MEITRGIPVPNVLKFFPGGKNIGNIQEAKIKPYLHALSSVKKFGGSPEDYIKIHEWFDQTKAHLADHRHRAILHSTFGIFLCEQVFGATITNSNGKQVSVRSIGEQHVLEDLHRIPSIQDWLQKLPISPWMGGSRKAEDVTFD